MYTVITIIHILACIFLVLVVLLQTGKGADMGAVFGGSSSTVFGSSGRREPSDALTTATAIVFMLTSLGLTYFSARRNSATVFDSAPAAARARDGAAGARAPVAPAPEAAPPANSGPPRRPRPPTGVRTDRLGRRRRITTHPSSHPRGWRNWQTR